MSLATRGFSIVDAPAWVDRIAAQDPWQLAEELLEVDIDMVERHPIIPREGGRSFASNRAFTPLHTDSQDFMGRAPDVQVMACIRPAQRGGETTMLDTWALTQTIARDEPRLFEAIVAEPREFSFVFGAVHAPTLVQRDDRLTFTHTPTPRDAIGQAVQRWVDAATPDTRRIEGGQVLVLDNLRMLHGRQAFEGTQRRFVRLLVWTREPVHTPPADLLAATSARAVRSPGLSTSTRVVLDLLRGESPGVLAHHHGIDEATLYRWRNQAIAAADDALIDRPRPRWRWRRHRR